MEDSIQRMEFRDLDGLEERENGMFFPSGGAVDGEAQNEGSDVEENPSEASIEDGEAPRGYSEEEVEGIRQEAYDQGRQEGLEEGYASGKEAGREEKAQELDEAAQALADALERINNLRGYVLNRNKQDMVRLARVIAEQVIHVEVSSRESAIIRAVERAIQEAVQSEEYRIRVNPGDMNVVVENKPLFLASMSGLQNIVFESDEEISSGGCVVESDQGKVDATIETQLEKIQDKLMAEIASEDTRWKN